MYQYSVLETFLHDERDQHLVESSRHHRLFHRDSEQPRRHWLHKVRQ